MKIQSVLSYKEYLLEDFLTFIVAFNLDVLHIVVQISVVNTLISTVIIH